MTASTVTPSPSFWQRRLLGPLRTQLTQGATPDRIALTVAVGTACSVLPFLGCTTVFNLLVGLALRLNHPILQAVNYLLTAVQLALILVYVRIGETLWGAPHLALSLGEMTDEFRASPANFLRHFAATGLYAATAWLLTVPVIIAVVYFPLRPVLRRLAARYAPKLGS